MHAKYEVSISNGSKVIANVKVDNRQTNKQTNKQTDRQTNKQTGQKQYAPDHSIRGHKKEHNSCKKWQKLMAFKLDLMCIKIKWYTKFQMNMSKHVGEKCGKLWWTDGHHHTIIRPVWRRAYKKFKKQVRMWNTYAPDGSPKLAVFNEKVTVKVTRSLTLVLFERVQ